MPVIKYQTQVPASPEQVYEHVTGYSATGAVSRRGLEQKHGRLLEQDGDTYTFEDAGDEKVIWRCTFNPPHQRTMRALESKWADRIDWFQPSGDGTLWTVVWEPKAVGFRSYTQWLAAKLTGKSKIYNEAIAPVLRHFQEPQEPPPRPARPRSSRARARRRRR